MIKLSDFELSTAKEIVNIGLVKAADSLSFFLQEKILIDQIDFRIQSNKKISCYTTLKRNNNFVLTTNVIGEIQGACYLVFSKNDTKRILDKSLPGSFKFNDETLTEMGNAILLEIDNIVSASVITQFSNLLKFKMHGGVPNLKKIHGGEFLDFQKNELTNTNVAVTFRTRLISLDKTFSPEFIWALDKNFFDGVKNYIENSEELEKIKHTKEQPIKQI